MPDRPIRAHRILQMMGRQRQAYPPATFKASKRSAGLYFLSKSTYTGKLEPLLNELGITISRMAAPRSPPIVVPSGSGPVNQYP